MLDHRRGRNFVRYSCLMLAVAAGGAGCASALHGTTEKIAFASEPPGASVIVDGNSVGTTPAEIELARHNAHAVKIEKAGYLPYEVTTSTTFNRWALADYLLALVFPPIILIEYIDDGSYEIEPHEVTAHLIAAPAETTP